MAPFPVALPPGAAPMPLKAMACGLPLASLLMLSVTPVITPIDAGLKTMEITQLALAARVVPQESALLTKSPALAPAIATPPMLSVAAPLLVSVTLRAVLVVPCVWLAKLKLAGDRLN